jgi:uncharacterized repeat protein (TIGR04138 family)
MSGELDEKIELILQRDDRYSSDAYEFIGRAVAFSVKRRLDSGRESKHVSARELLEDIVVFAAGEFGPFAERVLRGWGIEASADIGNVVYNMIRVSALSADERDSRDDFDTDFDLFAGLRKAGELKSNAKVEVPVIA